MQPETRTTSSSLMEKRRWLMKTFLELKTKIDFWNRVIKLILGFKEEMLLTANLTYKTDFFLVRRLNGILEDFGLGKVDHGLHAIYHLGHKYRSREEKKETHHALEKCFIIAIQVD